MNQTENWRKEDESKFKCHYKLICKNCSKKFTTGNTSTAYCCSRCRFEYEKEKQAKIREAARQLPCEKECVVCKSVFYAPKHYIFCSPSCKETKKNQDYLLKWSSGMIDEAKRAKMARKNQIKLDWHTTEIKDPINKKLKVMRG
jgi:hypothetical protein